MAESFVAVAVAVPECRFPDEDEICLAAGRFVCEKLESYLVHHGHSIPEWIQGGCDEDWGVYLESKQNETTFEYCICFHPGPKNTTQDQMLVQYHMRPPLLKRLFRKPAPLLPDDLMHQTMRTFGDLFSSSRMLTRLELEKEF